MRLYYHSEVLFCFLYLKQKLSTSLKSIPVAVISAGGSVSV